MNPAKDKPSSKKGFRTPGNGRVLGRPAARKKATTPGLSGRGGKHPTGQPVVYGESLRMARNCFMAGESTLFFL